MSSPPTTPALVRSAGQPIEVVRAIRDDIQARVTTLLGQVLHHY